MNKKSIEDIKSYWDQRIGDSDGSWSGVLWVNRPIWNDYVDKLQMHYLNMIFNINTVKSSDLILDLGCGVGRHTFRLANLCKEIHGVDSSNKAIEICRRKCIEDSYTNMKFGVMDVRRLTFDDETFDWVLSVTCLQHITNEMDLADSIHEALRVTKSGGKVILLECANDNRNDEFVGAFPQNTWFKYINSFGGEIEDWYGIDIPFMRKICNISASSAKILKIDELNRIMEQISTCILKMFEYKITKVFKAKSWYTMIIINKKF